MQTRSQKYATTIYAQVAAILARYPDDAGNNEVNEEHQKQRRKYGSMAYKLPVLIRKAGLPQALAFVDARPDAVQQELLVHLAAVIGLDPNDLLRRSREDSLGDHMRLTQQILDALLWYKRFVQSLLKVELSDDETEVAP